MRPASVRRRRPWCFSYSRTSNSASSDFRCLCTAAALALHVRAACRMLACSSTARRLRSSLNSIATSIFPSRLCSQSVNGGSELFDCHVHGGATILDYDLNEHDKNGGGNVRSHGGRTRGAAAREFPYDCQRRRDF